MTSIPFRVDNHNDDYRRSAKVDKYLFSPCFRQFHKNVFEQLVDGIRDYRFDEIQDPYADHKFHTQGSLFSGKVLWKIENLGGEYGSEANSNSRIVVSLIDVDQEISVKELNSIAA